MCAGVKMRWYISPSEHVAYYLNQSSLTASQGHNLVKSEHKDVIHILLEPKLTLLFSSALALMPTEDKLHKSADKSNQNLK